jgi:N-acyl-D-amino-acid deacylase
MDIGEGMAKMGCDQAEFMVSMYLQNDEGQVKTAGIMGDEDVATILKHPFAMVGTDSFVVDGQQIDPLQAHPRNYETYPYTLKKFVYDEELISLENCIYKMSGMVAERLNLADRGKLKAGCWADVTVFDPNTLATRCTLTEPSEYPTGIVLVLVNGQIAVKDGVCTGVKAGMTIRNPVR